MVATMDFAPLRALFSMSRRRLGENACKKTFSSKKTAFHVPIPLTRPEEKKLLEVLSKSFRDHLSKSHNGFPVDAHYDSLISGLTMMLHNGKHYTSEGSSNDKKKSLKDRLYFHINCCRTESELIDLFDYLYFRSKLTPQVACTIIRKPELVKNLDYIWTRVCTGGNFLHWSEGDFNKFTLLLAKKYLSMGNKKKFDEIVTVRFSDYWVDAMEKGTLLPSSMRYMWHAMLKLNHGSKVRAALTKWQAIVEYSDCVLVENVSKGLRQLWVALFMLKDKSTLVAVNQLGSTIKSCFTSREKLVANSLNHLLRSKETEHIAWDFSRKIDAALQTDESALGFVVDIADLLKKQLHPTERLIRISKKFVASQQLEKSQVDRVSLALLLQRLSSLSNENIDRDETGDQIAHSQSLKSFKYVN
ncbi:uncharacterized protein V1510DRAFT_221193 [Dipodascopsis tothii]|uniref:uncharacterized protein n=1 Tax=Dipodascopsis tothii TaxID=44089 RepID=UPI0034CE6B3B